MGLDVVLAGVADAQRDGVLRERRCEAVEDAGLVGRTAEPLPGACRMSRPC